MQKIMIGGAVLMQGTCIKIGIFIAQEIFSSKYETGKFGVAIRRLPDRTNRMVAMLWVGVLLTFTLIFVVMFVLAFV